MAKNTRERRSHSNGRERGNTSNDTAVRDILLRFERKARRLSGSRAKSTMKRDYAKAAKLVHSVIPRR